MRPQAETDARPTITMRSLTTAALCLALSSCSLFRPRPPVYDPVYTASGLTLRDLVFPDQGELVHAGDTVTMTHAGVNMSGQPESGTTILRADGKEHPASEQSPEIVVVTRWLGSHILEMVAKQNGQVIGQGTYKVSSDGSTLTATVWGTDANGAPFEQVIVSDRESTGRLKR